MKIKPNHDLQQLAFLRHQLEPPGGRKGRLAAEKEARRKARNKRKAGKR